MSSSLYLLVNLGAIAIPFAFSWHPKIRFVDQWRSFWPACLITLAFFIAWDVLFTAQGVWGFNESYLVGLSLLGLPLEEWLFFVAIPYACVFTYFVFRTVRNSDAGKVSQGALLFIFVLSASLCLFHLDNAYTATATGFNAIYCLILFRSKPAWLSDFLISFLVLLIPFVLTNGILTGLDFWQASLLHAAPESIQDQVVWYANDQNMGVRFLTIPIEDFFYAFLLIGMNVTLFERFRAK